MALVRKLNHQNLERDTKHTDVECTYSIVQTNEGNFLQIDTYGSISRQERGKKSQSIRFAPEAIEELKQLIAKL